MRVYVRNDDPVRNKIGVYKTYERMGTMFS